MPEETQKAHTPAPQTPIEAPQHPQQETLQQAHEEEIKTLRLRHLAEQENNKRRWLLQMDSAKKFAVDACLKSLLPVLDSLDHALSCQTQEGLHDGVELTRAQLVEALSAQGLRVIEAINVPFDPMQHHAMKVVESTVLPSNQVVQLHQKGYQLHERLIRPALVEVTRQPEN